VWHRLLTTPTIAPVLCTGANGAASAHVSGGDVQDLPAAGATTQITRTHTHTHTHAHTHIHAHTHMYIYLCIFG